MTRLFTIVVLLLAVTMPAVSQEDSTQAPADSGLPLVEPLPPLSLAAPRDDSLDLLSGGSLTSPEFNSWMSIPSPGGLPSAPSEFIPQNSRINLSQQRGAPFQSDLWLLESRANLLSPLRLELKSQEKYQIWRTILGSVQVGGMAYLLYLHFKKYGLR